jgi:REP element-mobilizing transposase RayT
MSATYLSLNYHLVFSTKGRSAFIRPCWIDRCHAYLGGTVKGLEAVPEAIGGTDDHVHLLVGLRSRHCLATFMCELKKSVSVWAKENHESLFMWQTGYAAFTVGTRERETVRNTYSIKKNTIGT